MLLFKKSVSVPAGMRGHLLLKGTAETNGPFRELGGEHVSLTKSLWLQTMVVLTAGDTVELQGSFRAQDGYFASEQTSFWGCKIGKAEKVGYDDAIPIRGRRSFASPM